MQQLYHLVGLAAGATLALAPGAGMAANAAGSLPRPRPALALRQPLANAGTRVARNTHVRNAGPDLARGRVPLPRPKPSRATTVPQSQDSIGSDLSPSTSGSWSQQEVQAARLRCTVLLMTSSGIVAAIKDPIGGPHGCGIAAPIEVSGFGAVEVKPPATLNCNLAHAVYRWVKEVLQPAAIARFNSPVFAIHNAASYACRRRDNAKTGRISEHAFGDALDVSGFELASGKVITVGTGRSTADATSGPTAQAAFLKDAHDGACRLFSTVLGPSADAAHRSHFHLDLARDGRYKICE